MKIKKVTLKDFKRFDDLTIDLGEDPKKIIALVGPNGCGKSSIFDAFEEELRKYKGSNSNPTAEFFSKLWYSIFPDKNKQVYNKQESILIQNQDNVGFDKKSFYVRSPYRFTPQLNVETIRSLPDVVDDSSRPGSSIALDGRLKENYERLLGIAWNEYQNGTKSGPDMRNELVGKINTILSSILEVKISNLGDVINGKGQLYFQKESSKDFPYENLSSGEKEVVDIIVDLVVKSPQFDNTVYCIDEPELHLNTTIQRKLLVEVEKLIPDNCQLWIATHSVGFLRALQDELKEKSQVLDFSQEDYFNGTKLIEPLRLTRSNWQRIFKTALEDLTGLIAPKRVIYCEGRADTAEPKEELGLDAIIYNSIFEEEFNDTLFVSAGGSDMPANLSITLQILAKTLSELDIIVLNDGDKSSDTSYKHISLKRLEVENYLLDKEVLGSFCNSTGKDFDSDAYEKLVSDIINQDIKPVQQQIKNLCGFSGSVRDFKLELAKFIVPSLNIYQELKQTIFI